MSGKTMRVWFNVAFSIMFVALALLAMPAFGQMSPDQVLEQANQAQLDQFKTMPAAQMTYLNYVAKKMWWTQSMAILGNRETTGAEKRAKIMELNRQYYNTLAQQGNDFFKATDNPYRNKLLPEPKAASAPRGLLQRVFGSKK